MAATTTWVTQTAWPTEMPARPATMADYRALTRRYAADFAIWRKLDEGQLHTAIAHSMDILARDRAFLANAQANRPSYAQHIVTRSEQEGKAAVVDSERRVSLLREMINLRRAGKAVD